MAFRFKTPSTAWHRKRNRLLAHRNNPKSEIDRGRTVVSQERQAFGRILTADDQASILEAIELPLRPHGYIVDGAKSPAAMREFLASEFYDAVIAKRSCSGCFA